MWPSGMRSYILRQLTVIDGNVGLYQLPRDAKNCPTDAGWQQCCARNLKDR
jgi:hypothetical protein